MNYRTLISIVLVLSIIFFPSAITYASNLTDNTFQNETEKTEAKHKEILEIRGFNGTYKKIDLYNANEVKQWLMYYDESSYLILDTTNGEVMEYGYDCVQPYEEYIKGKCFYGGPLCYYIESDGKYYEIKEKKFYSASLKLKGVKLLTSDDEKSIQQEYIQSIGYTVTSLLQSVTVASPLNIQRQSFGNNKNGTCSAVATGIVLTYLNRTRADWYVPNSDYSSVNLENISFDATLYQKAEELHKLLISSGMGYSSYADGIKYPVATYKQQYLPNTTLSIDWRLFRNDPTYITNQIDYNIPGMITTTIFTNGYNFHTMAVYGYKKYSNGSYEYLVHTGWYQGITSSSSGYILPRIYIASNYETYMYKFNL